MMWGFSEPVSVHLKSNQILTQLKKHRKGCKKDKKQFDRELLVLDKPEELLERADQEGEEQHPGRTGLETF